MGADGCYLATLHETGESCADVGGPAHDQSCIVGGGECADRKELTNGGVQTTGAEMAVTVVPVLEGVPRPDPGQRYAYVADGEWQSRYDGGSSGATQPVLE